MPSYKVDTGGSKLVVCAMSSIHDTNTVWDKIAGNITIEDLDKLAELGAGADFEVDMTSYDAGDWLRNRKLKKDLDLGSHPKATFELTGLRDVEQKDDGSFSAIADGTLRWRGREVTLAIEGTGTIDDDAIRATGKFDMNITDVGMKPPRFLMFKMEEGVTVEVTLVAKAA